MIVWFRVPYFKRFTAFPVVSVHLNSNRKYLRFAIKMNEYRPMRTYRMLVLNTRLFLMFPEPFTLDLHLISICRVKKGTVYSSFVGRIPSIQQGRCSELKGNCKGVCDGLVSDRERFACSHLPISCPWWPFDPWPSPIKAGLYDSR